jgi:hypothetical protein
MSRRTATSANVVALWKRVGVLYVALAAVLTLTILADGSGRGTRVGPPRWAVEIPGSIRAEHLAIHAALEDAMQAPGDVGPAARALAEVLHPHFVREEEIALPPLGLLAPLAAGDLLPGAADILPLTDALRRELPRMLDEHTHIRLAVGRLREAARRNGARRYEELADELALHARTEEEVLYPAAIVVGDLVRARMAGISGIRKEPSS